MTHILIPREPSPALLRPFVGCPQEELPQAYAAMIRIAEVERARAGSQCLAQIEEPAGAAPAAVAPQGEYPPLPEGVMFIEQIGGDVIARPTEYAYFKNARGVVHGAQLFTADQLRAYFDLGRQTEAPALEAPPAVAPQGEYPHEQMDAMALARYKVVPSHASMLWSHAVVAGDGAQQLYVGREVECQNMARKFAGAFLDGAFAFHSMAAAPTAQAAPALEAPAAPGVPAGFALVPIEPTQQMLDAGRWSGAGSVSIQEEWARKEVWSRMLATITPPPAAYADDLVALVVNLVQALSAAAPDNDLAGHALDYLKRNGLQGSPLRAAEAAPQAPAAPVANPAATWTSTDDGLPEHGDLVLCDFGLGHHGGGIRFGYEVLKWDEHHVVANVSRWLKLDRLLAAAKGEHGNG